MKEILLAGNRLEIDLCSEVFPDILRRIPQPPGKLYCLGNPEALKEGLAVVGARGATPYGLGCAERFAGLAASRGIPIISGGAKGCDSAAHRAALRAGGTTVCFVGGGCNYCYPAENATLFQEIIDAGGLLVSESAWDVPPQPYLFRARNRLIAGLSLATLIVEAGMPSGTFSTADEALVAGREVWAVPGAITSGRSLGANYLICQGATPIIDDRTFLDALFCTFGALKCGKETEDGVVGEGRCSPAFKALYRALCSQPMSLEEMVVYALEKMDDKNGRKSVMGWVTEAEETGLIQRFPGGKFGPVVERSPLE